MSRQAYGPFPAQKGPAFYAALRERRRGAGEKTARVKGPGEKRKT